jgi:hypothetical protein
MAEFVPSDFHDALYRELDAIGFYRSSPRVKICLSYGENNLQIKVEIKANLISVKPGFIYVAYPNIRRPKDFEGPGGFEDPEVLYKVGGVTVPKRTSWPFAEATTEELFVEYPVPRNISEYTDAHAWLSPVLPYRVELSAPEGFEMSVFERLGDRGAAMASEPISGHNQTIEFCHPHASFSHQGFVWSFNRRKSRSNSKVGKREPDSGHAVYNTYIDHMEGSSIQQAGSRSTQVQSTTYVQRDFDDLRRVLILLLDNFEELRLDPLAAKTAKVQIETLNAQLTHKPNPVIIKEAGKTLRNVTEGVVAGLITSAVQPSVWQSVQEVLARLFA